MLMGNKLILTVYVSITLLSIILIAYSMYLLHGAYDVGRLLNVSISRIEMVESNSNTTTVKIYLGFNNPSRFSLQLVSLTAYISLNGRDLTPHYAPVMLFAYSNPYQLPPYSENITVYIALEVPNYNIPKDLPRSWIVKLYFLINNVPLLERASYVKKISYIEGCS